MLMNVLVLSATKKEDSSSSVTRQDLVQDIAGATMPKRTLTCDSSGVITMKHFEATRELTVFIASSLLRYIAWNRDEMHIASVQ